MIVRGSRTEGVLDKDKAALALVALPVGLVVLLSVQVVEVTTVEDVAPAFLSARNKLGG